MDHHAAEAVQLLFALLIMMMMMITMAWSSG